MQKSPVLFEGSILGPRQYSWASLVVQIVKKPPAMQETWVQSLGEEDPLEEGMATHSSILAWKIPMETGAWRALLHGVTKSRTQLSDQAQHRSKASWRDFVSISKKQHSSKQSGRPHIKKFQEYGPLMEKVINRHFYVCFLRTGCQEHMEPLSSLV